MFEITGNDIAVLNDGHLRTLIALLCEAELRARDLPTSYVTAGGNQDAPDGGVDVRVALPAGATIDGYIPRASTGFQVKKPDMPRSAIVAEMKPSGTVRSVIRELADNSGAYIMVSSTGSTSDGALRSRRKAMSEAVASLPNASALTLDFYDRERIAGWVRSHPGLIPWVRGRIGKAVPGWQSYGAWAYAPEGPLAEYLTDDKVRIRPDAKGDKEVTALEGIAQIRERLRAPRAIVRLVGLSGVGKTRLAQALFDDRLGEQALDPSLAIYTNLADGPDPQPVGLASDLIAARTQAIVVVDNCPPDLHRRLSELCRAPESTLSVLTIEYDIRDDQPEGTDVFAVEPASTALIAKLLERRFPELSQVDAGTIANSSGGNARIAMALAATVGKNDSIAGLTDEELFLRLFQQRHEHDRDLLLIAQACALVYSFRGEELSGANTELPQLGALIGKSAQDVYRAVAELQRRDLVQQRNVWRAVLPHAIANRLAALALQNIPFAAIEEHLMGGGSERLLKSFSRRLSYLDGSKEAMAIAEQWLGPGGLLEIIANLNELGITMLNNIAPVVPDSVLAAMERTILGPDGDAAIAQCKHFVRLLRSLAYDAMLFDRAATLLVKFAEAGREGERNEAADVLASLFSIHLSGTHATIEQRVAIAKTLLQSPSSIRQELGLSALKNLLSTGPFSSSYSFEFGARSRDHGYWPAPGDDVKHWFETALALAETLATGETRAAARTRALLADAFRGLWNAGMEEALDGLFRRLAQREAWRDGWIAVRQTQQYDAKGMADPVARRLAALEQALRPDRLTEKVRAIVLSSNSGRLDFDEIGGEDDVGAAMQRHGALVHDLGQQVARDESAFTELLPQIVSGSGQLWGFGQGLGAGSTAPRATWDALVAGFGRTAAGDRNDLVLRGFLCGLHERERALAAAMLDEAVEHDILGPYFPALQCAVPIDARGVGRIKRAIALGMAPIERFRVLAWGRCSDPIPGADLKEILFSIASQPETVDVAIEILSMRLFSDREQGRSFSPELLQAGRELLSKLSFGEKDDKEDHNLKGIVMACLKGDEGAAVATGICRSLRGAVASHKTSASYHDDLLTGLLKVQPAACLDGLFGGEKKEQKQGLSVIRDMRYLRANPLDAVPGDQLLEWCRRDAETRFPIAASVVTFSAPGAEDAPLRWSEVALALIEHAPDRVAVLKGLVSQLRPMSWSGSRAAILENNAKLLDQFESYPDPDVVEFVAQEKMRLSQEIGSERRFESEHDREADERFEE